MPGIQEFTSEFFDASSRAWMANKERSGASVGYVCTIPKRDGAPCGVSVKAEAMEPLCCRRHRKGMVTEKKQALVAVLPKKYNTRHSTVEVS
jgi:hypothetical protein